MDLYFNNNQQKLLLNKLAKTILDKNNNVISKINRNDLFELYE